MTQKDSVRRLLRKSMTRSWVRNPLHTLTQASILPSSIWRRLPVETNFKISLPEGGSFVYSAVANDAIGRSLFWRGLRDWESETVPIFCRYARRSRLVLDIGANTGVYSLLACAANPHSEVISYEPVPQICHRLSENIALNGWEERCEVRNEAVSDIAGKAELHVPYGGMLPPQVYIAMDFGLCKGCLLPYH